MAGSGCSHRQKISFLCTRYSDHLSRRQLRTPPPTRLIANAGKPSPGSHARCTSTAAAQDGSIWKRHGQSSSMTSHLLARSRIRGKGTLSTFRSIRKRDTATGRSVSVRRRCRAGVSANSTEPCVARPSQITERFMNSETRSADACATPRSPRAGFASTSRPTLLRTLQTFPAR